MILTFAQGRVFPWQYEQILVKGDEFTSDAVALKETAEDEASAMCLACSGKSLLRSRWSGQDIGDTSDDPPNFTHRKNALISKLKR